MTIATRLAVVAGGLLLLATAVLAFLPMTSDSTSMKCGSAVIAKVSGDDVAQAKKFAGELRDGGYELLGQLDDGSNDQAVAAVTGTVECGDQIKDRRLLVVGVGVAALLIPAAIVFVGAGRRRA